MVRALERLVDLVERRLLDALEQGDPGQQRLGEVELAAHRRFRDAGDLVLAARVGGDHLDDLALDQRGVDVHDHEALGVPQDAVLLHRDVDPLLVGDRGQVGLQLVGVGAGDLHADRGHRVARHADDAVDVAAVVLDALRQRGHGGRTQRGTQHHDLRAAHAAGAVVAHTVLDGDLEPEVPADAAHDPLESAEVVGKGDEGAEDEPAAHDELLDIDDLDAGRGELAEQPCRDTALVGTREGHQDGRIGEVHGGHGLGHRT
jgi:hypothetical protein